MSEIETRRVIIKKLDELMTEHQLTNTEVAKICGVHVSTVGKWLLGKAVPRMGALSKLARYYDLDVSYFFNDEDPEISEDAELEHLIEMLHKDEGLRILLSSGAKLTKKDLEMVIELAQRMDKEGV